MTAALLEYGEEKLVEYPAMRLLGQLGWETFDAMAFKPGEGAPYGRESFSDVVLGGELLEALKAINPHLPEVALRDAAAQVAASRPNMQPVMANREVYGLLKEGVTVSYNDSEGEQQTERVKLIDWDNAENNRFLAVNQLWMVSPDGLYTRRPDIIGFVNGLPLVLIELKATHKNVKDAFDDNLRDYRDTLPGLFEQNAILVASNGHEAKVGSLTAGWEHFSDWKKVEHEDEPKRPGLETLLRGVMDKRRLLDLVENFTLFSEIESGLAKIVAMNHQYLGVNNALEALKHSKQNGGRLGVFWHTQGSGKSYSMVFFSQKVLRKVPGNWSFLVVTDRDELDGQIYKTFARAGAVHEPEEAVRAGSGAHLRELLGQDHRYLFTLIQKFRTEKGETYPTISQRDDIIVMTDEAHRSQYDIFAGNMRSALPHAAFIGFTGTPLMASGEEKTREVFGDYVSIYNFSDAVDDGATVPLYYENRIPELQLTNEDFQGEMEEVLDEHSVDEEGEKEVQRRFGRQYQLIVRPDRLDTIASDLVGHFLGRGQFGKGMVVSIDKATAVRMYDRVRARWQDEIVKVEAELLSASGDERDRLLARLELLKTTDMAVVVSQGQNEIDDFKKLGLDITTHRKRMVSENLEEKFKDASDPLRLVFVCAMWMTGFDAPSVSTIYLDKPMRNHTLMQTIARANRVWEQKVSGLIVDYIGVFRDLEKALAIYGGAKAGGAGPVQPKAELLVFLKEQAAVMRAFLKEQGIDADAVLAAQDFDLMQALADTKDALLKTDTVRNKFIKQATLIDRLYRAVLPDPLAQPYTREWALYQALVRELQKENGDGPVDVEGVMASVEHLMDESVKTYRYAIPQDAQKLDLSKIDFEKLSQKFAGSPHKFTEADKLKRALNARVTELTRLNKTRTNFAEQLQRMIDEYNQGAASIETLYANLIEFGQSLDAEGQRAAREGLSEEELAIFDLVMKPGGPTSRKDEKAIKAMARHLVEKLKENVLVLDWRKKQQTQARVRKAIREELRALGTENGELQELVQSLYAHIHDAYPDRNRSVYA
ncbi:type I restriction endonuclease subunit R [Deinococcus enclensis]|uniref:Type I restriction enzyme endonuclease subunit n=1 Tax=Deinococcus enclensis TaxID=1049582 RepID=A0ABT9MD74_9DEIO|nr:type I restriction endonuclease subunit R [Deinococcus enclensis]MDP9764466.1 type I restriction enzyme R subunit [Deinococcus enclensis]